MLNKKVIYPLPYEIVDKRLSINLTQKEASSIVYCHLNTWQQWEAGTRKMHPAFWELFNLKTKRKKSSAQALKMISISDERIRDYACVMDAPNVPEHHQENLLKGVALEAVENFKKRAVEIAVNKAKALDKEFNGLSASEISVNELAIFIKALEP